MDRATPTCAECQRKNMGLIAEICPFVRGQASSHPLPKRYAKGDVLFEEGEEAKGVYGVTSGSIRLFKTGSDGREQILRIAQRGDLLGCRSIYAGEPFSASAVAREATQVCYFDKQTFMRLLQTNSGVGPTLAREISKELGRAREELLERRGMDASARLASCLLRLARPDGKIIATRHEISDMIGTAPETVSRQLKRMQASGAVKSKGRVLQVADREALQSLAVGEVEGSAAGAGV